MSSTRRPYKYGAIQNQCYELDSVLSKRHTLVLSNTRELNREFHTEMFTYYDGLCYYFLSLP